MAKYGRFAALGILLLSSHSAMAVCSLDPDPKYGSPTILQIPSYIIYVDADAAVDENIPVSDVISDRQPNIISYLCASGENYGKAVNPPLSPPNIAQRLFDTQVPGLRVRPKWSNGTGEGQFESISVVPDGRFDIPASSFFRLQFVKTAPRLQLKDATNGDLVLPAGILLYNWINSRSEMNYYQKLQIGEIRVISTPVCKITAPSEVDYNTVSPTNLKNGVARPLDFSMSCATDYDDYSVQASLIARQVTTDGFIQVTDQGGNTDRMKIRVEDNLGNKLPLDGTGGQRIEKLASNVPANFNWRTTLLPGASALPPESGAFSAMAEIMLVVN